MNDLELYTRTWGATAVPFGPLSETQWVAIPSQQRAVTLLNQTVALRGVMLLSGGNGMGKSTLVGRWVRQLENRLYSSQPHPSHFEQQWTPGQPGPGSRQAGQHAPRT
jgi:MoxR-like ATPase